MGLRHCVSPLSWTRGQCSPCGISMAQRCPCLTLGNTSIMAGLWAQPLPSNLGGSALSSGDLTAWKRARSQQSFQPGINTGERPAYWGKTSLLGKKRKGQKDALVWGCSKHAHTCTHTEFCVSCGHILTYKKNDVNQQGPTVQHRELYSISYSNLCGKRFWKSTYMCLQLNHFAVHLKLTQCCKLTVFWENFLKMKRKV